MENKTTIEEVNVRTVIDKYKRDYRKSFWKDIYNNRLDDEKKEILNNVLGSNQTLWKIANSEGIDFDSIKQEKIKSEFENETPGYIGRFSGDLNVTYKGSVKLGFGKSLKIYYKEYQKSIDTRSFW